MSKIKILKTFILFGLSATFLFGFSFNEAKGSDWGIGLYLGDSDWGLNFYWGYPYYYSYYPYYDYSYTYTYTYYPYYTSSPYYDYSYAYYPNYYSPSFSFFYESYDYDYQSQPDPQVDLKVNGLDSFLSLPYSNKTINLSWSSQYADFCQASGDWSGSKSTSGSEQITLSTPKTYQFNLTCKNSSGREASDSVTVNLQSPGAPRVITKMITW
jgi:hypothetical protein